MRLLAGSSPRYPRRHPLHRQPALAQSRDNQVTPLCTNGVHRREFIGTGPVVLKGARVTGVTLMDQFIWEEEGGVVCFDCALSLRNLVSGYECGRAFPAGVGPGSPSKDAANWPSSRFSRSVETRRRYGWLKMVLPRCAPLPS